MKPTPPQCTKPERNLWPFGILLTFVLFIGGTIALIVIACANDADLVSQNYYEEEMQFQKQIDRIDRGRDLQGAAAVAYDADRRRILITLPADHVRNETHGNIQLYRPSAAGLDQTIVLKPDANGAQILDASALQPGLWKVKVFWTANGADYRVDQNVVILARQS